MNDFQHIRLALAREPGHPNGDPGNGWDIVAPLDAGGRLDLRACRAEPERCHVRRFVDGETVATGRLHHGVGDRWRLDLDGRDDLDARGFRLGEERFVVGEYVSILSADDSAHTYVVERVGPVAGGPERAGAS
ncbi:hypothetical protein MMB232_02908 [Brevundimonas subvibrioides]|uniref:hypothetical protein n=1 Tax=Brevundimonas subvibrioides TaxID=74313 RepID=UPI0032D58F0B